MNVTCFQATHNQLLRTTPAAQIVAGSVNTHAVQFSFDEAWDNLSITAIFCAGDEKIALRITDPDTTYLIPHEVMAHSNTSVLVGVYGVDQDGTLVMPSCYAKACDIVTAGADMNATQGTQPTPSIYEQWIADITTTVDTASNTAQSAAQSVEATSAQMDALKELILHPPKINAAHHWLLWDETERTYQDSGVCATGQPGEQGEPGEKGDTGDAGARGAAFTYDDFTPAQLEALKGEPGAPGEKGDTGDAGARGAAFTYADFTPAQLEALKGEPGAPGEKGDTGDAGARGAAFTYDDFTPAQLEALKGEPGAPGEKGDTGDAGELSADVMLSSIYGGSTAGIVAEADHATTADSATPTSHASADATYGVGNNTLNGHVKLHDSIKSSLGVYDGYAATPNAVRTAYNIGVIPMSVEKTGNTFELIGDLPTGSTKIIRFYSPFAFNSGDKYSYNGVEMTLSHVPTFAAGRVVMMSVTPTNTGCSGIVI